MPHSVTILNRLLTDGQSFMRSMLIAMLLAVGFLEPARSSPLDDYVDSALTNNLALQQSLLSVEAARAGLAEARGRFLPRLDLIARYTRAGGGRSIEIPVGDLVNPINSAVNDLNGSPILPTSIPNESIPLLREEEQETKLSLVQPIFQPAIWHGYRAQRRVTDAESFGRRALARDVILEVQLTYNSFVAATELVRLFDSTRILLEENERVSELLVETGRATADVVFRARAELAELRQQQAAAIRDRELTRSFFNFLLNRPLDAAIIIAAPDTVVRNSDLPTVVAASSSREELLQLTSLIDAAGSQASIARSSFLPGVSVAVDYGIEGESYEFDSDADFWTASLVLNWNLFNGGSDQARVRQAQLAQNEIRAQYEEVRRQLAVAARDAWYQRDVARETLAAAEERVAAARESFRLIDRQFSAGQVAQIVWLDARTTLTNSEINAIVALYQYASRGAELQRATAATELPEFFTERGAD